MRPRLVVAHSDEKYVAQVCQSFRLRGWDVYLAPDGPEARRFARDFDARALILEADLPGDSGWLTAAKASRELPRVKIFLTSPAPSGERQRFASFVGATLIRRADGVAALVELVCGTTLPAAG
jgi:DNA-binding response OmpR family regulator